MQRRVMWVAGGVLVVVAALALRHAGQHAARQAVNADLQQMIAQLPPGYAVTHGATEVSPLTGTLTLHDVALSYLGRVVATAGRLTFSGADQDGLRAVFDPAAYPGGRPAGNGAHALLSDAVAKDVVFPPAAPAGPRVTVGLFAVHGLSGRQFFEAPTPVVARTPAFAADVGLALRAASVEWHDIAVTGAPGRAFSVSELVARDYAGGRVANASVQSLSFDVTNARPRPSHVHGGMASLVLRDVDMGAYLRAVREGAPARSSSRGTGEMRGEGMVLTILPGPSMTAESFTASSGLPDAKGMREGHGAVRHFAVSLKDAPMGAAGTAVLQAFGTDSFVLDGQAETVTDTRSNQLDFTEDLALQGLATLKLAGRAVVPPQPVGNADPQYMLKATTIEHASLRWVDQGFVNKALAAAAAVMHSTPEEVRAQMAIPLVSVGFFMPEQPDAVDQLTAFLNHPQTLTVTLSPPAPFTLAQAMAAKATGMAVLMGAHVQAQ